MAENEVPLYCDKVKNVHVHARTQTIQSRTLYFNFY